MDEMVRLLDFGVTAGVLGYVLTQLKPEMQKMGRAVEGLRRAQLIDVLGREGATAEAKRHARRELADAGALTAADLLEQRESVAAAR